MIEFVTCVTKVCNIDPISAENSSEANKEGKILLRGVTKSTCWAEVYNLNACCKIIGVKNHKGNYDEQTVLRNYSHRLSQI